jgi:hypothetical protein
MSERDQAESDVIHLLQGIPSLTTVAIDFASDSLPAQRALISALTIRPGDTGAHPGGLCPILVSFSWADRRDTMDYPAFVQMVGMLRSHSRNVGVEFVRIYLNRIRMKTSGRWKQWMRILMEERINAGGGNYSQEEPGVV